MEPSASVAAANAQLLEQEMLDSFWKYVMMSDAEFTGETGKASS